MYFIHQKLHLLTFSTGKFEATMLRSYLRGSRLRRWLARPDCPLAIRECKILFDRVFAPTMQESIIGPDPLINSVPEDLRSIVSDSPISFRSNFRYDRHIYSRYQTHLGNSLIHFYPNGSRRLSPIPGSIKYIFHQDGKVSFAVHRHLPAPSNVIDPFRHYPHVQAKLYSSVLNDRLEIIELSSVFGHFARWCMTPELTGVLSLNRVSSPLSILCFRWLIFSKD